MDYTKLAGAVRVAGALAAGWAAYSGRANGIVRVGLGFAALALAVKAYADLTATSA